MNIRILQLLFIASSALLFTGCKDNDDTRYSEEENNKYVNDWIYDNMDVYYYWRDQMPGYNNTNTKLEPVDYFESILYPYKSSTHEGDRFSWIQNNYSDLLNALNGISPNEIGFEYIPYYQQGSTTYVEFYVAYIKKGTKAESSGLKRGDIINKVDGVQLTSQNWSAALYQNKRTYDLEGTNFTGKITVEVTSNYKEDPIYHEEIYNINGTKTGYIVYNQFVPDNGDGSYKYDIALANIFQKYESENVTNVILDLRYNGGGYVSCAVNLASALVPNRKTENKLFYNKLNSIFDAQAKREWGAEGYDEFVNGYFKTDVENSRGNAVGAIPGYGNRITKLYILTGKNTASASELIINGLSPYMKEKIVLIGDVTYGKNVGSISIYKEKDSRNKWGMQPIVMQSFNVNDESEYAGGFTPGESFNGYLVDEFDEIETDGLKKLGDPEETLLSIALTEIAGNSPRASLKKSAISIRKSIGASFALKPGAYTMTIDNSKTQQLIKSLNQVK